MIDATEAHAKVAYESSRMGAAKWHELPPSVHRHWASVAAAVLGVAPSAFHCAREGMCDVTPRCTAQCAACADGVREVPTPLPLFALGVARRKWESLQAEGYRMQRIEFAMSKDGIERRGSIDPWGKVLWHSDGVKASDSETKS